MISAKSLKELKHVFEKKRTFVLLTHVSPEPDTIGAALSLYHYLTGRGKRVRVYNFDGLPNFMRFMEHADVVRPALPRGRFDAAVCVDAGDIEMLGDDFEKIKAGVTVNIDHHGTNKMYGNINIVESCASATCELMYTLFRKLRAPIDGTMASLLLAGIIYDTGSFRYRNTTSKTLRVASELIKAGADAGGINERLYENQSLGRLKLLEMVLNTLELRAGDRVASIELTTNMYDATGTTREDSEGMIDYPKSIKGVVVAVLFREAERGKYKISFRSKRDFNVADIAEDLGGGGHRNAAGCTMYGRLDDIKDRVFAGIAEKLKR